ncbi:MAG: hypothetical protein AB1305_02225 [Candidatus Hadarchaeota archaeon]
MGALNYISYVVFAAIFIGIGFTLVYQYSQGAAERDFLVRVEELSNQIRNLSLQDAGSSANFSITVPSGSQLSFENTMVLAQVGGRVENFNAGVAVSGPAFDGGGFTLKLLRTQEGVTVSAA